MSIRLVANICICVCTGFGFFHGLVRCLGKQSPLFLVAVTGAMGCMMSGRLFAVVLQLCGGQTVSRMNLGYLGVIGCFLFMYGANYGDIRERIGGVRNKLAYVIGALTTAPVLYLIYIIVSSIASPQYKVLYSVVAIIVMHNAFYIVVFMILKDRGDGLLKMLRPYCVAAFIFSYAHLGEIYFAFRVNSTMQMVSYVLICLSGLILLPLLERSYIRWGGSEVHNG